MFVWDVPVDHLLTNAVVIQRLHRTLEWDECEACCTLYRGAQILEGFPNRIEIQFGDLAILHAQPNK